MNAPVSVDGGTGFNKLVILGTEYADHIVVTAVRDLRRLGSRSPTRTSRPSRSTRSRATTRSTSSRRRPASRRAPSAGSAATRSTSVGNVVGDVFARDIEGTSGTVNHQVTSLDPNYNCLVAPGINLSVARGNQGQVVITESDGFTAVYENGCFKTVAGGCRNLRPRPSTPTPWSSPQRLRFGTNVYVTESASPFTAGRGPGSNDVPAVPSSTAGRTASRPRRSTSTPSSRTAPRSRFPTTRSRSSSTRPTGTSSRRSSCSRPTILLPQGNRDVSINTSVLSTDPNFDGAQVTNVLATLYDGDGPGVLVTRSTRRAMWPTTLRRSSRAPRHRSTPRSPTSSRSSSTSAVVGDRRRRRGPPPTAVSA